MSFLDRITRTESRATTILIRLLVGGVFISEGIQKFLFPESVGAGRFEKIGFSNPEFTAYFVGSSEILFGTFVLLGLLIRVSVLPLIIVMLTAISTTKIPILIESGFWKMAHESRTDFSMLTGLIFLLIEGGGRWSVDHLLRGWRKL